jgi:predicted NBD/HSP70 family sugar kinase
VDDTIIRGASGNAGDIGHLVVDPRGPECECGLRGCLGVTLSPSALVQRAVASRLLSGAHLDAVRTGDPARIDESFAALCALVDDGNAGARELIEASARQLAKAVTTLANMMDTDVVAIGGPTWMRLRNVYLPLLDGLVRPGLVRGNAGKPLTIVGTALGDDVIAIGAACLVLDHEFAPAVTSIALAH